MSRQEPERMVFFSKMGYPLWLYSRTNQTFLFNALRNSSYSISYVETPSAKVFADALEAQTRPRENFTAFLADHEAYFQQNFQEKKLTLEGLIADPDFKAEFSSYRKEASETSPSNIAPLSTTLDETAVLAMLVELEKLQMSLKEDSQRLSECLRLVNKTTTQHMTELNYEAAAATEEAEAKIKAQEQIVNPQISQLNKEYNRKIRDAADGFDKELKGSLKLQGKIEQAIKRAQEETRHYEQEAKAQAAKGHRLYEKHWREKVKKNQKELNALKKELKTAEANSKKLTDQKENAISEFKFELDREVKLARQPLRELEETREVRVQFFKEETQKLLSQEKPVVEGIKKAIKLRETVTAGFGALSMGEAGVKFAGLYYVPFFVACFEANVYRRYLVVAPSTLNRFDLSTRLKGVLGRSKIKDLLFPRFKAITALVKTVEGYAQRNPVFEQQLWSLGQKNNLLPTASFGEEVKNGLVTLRLRGWLSDQEQQDLNKQLASYR